MIDPTLPRCAWATANDPAMQAYHDTEWGVPEHDDTKLFEMLTLEGAQAGLSWRTVLMRRDAYREAYHGFDIPRVAAMTDAELEALIAGSGLIRNRLKIYSVRENAKAVLAVPGSLDAFLWSSGADSPSREGRGRPFLMFPASTAGPIPPRSPRPRRTPTA
jgi:DNA-3-methyladenine glycosylase I